MFISLQVEGTQNMALSQENGPRCQAEHVTLPYNYLMEYAKTLRGQEERHLTPSQGSRGEFPGRHECL